MSNLFTRAFTVLVALIILPGSGTAQGIGWPEAVSRLAGERTKAETCVALLKGHGDSTRISRGQLAYGKAKANIDAVIAGLITVLAEGEEPKGLTFLETQLRDGASSLAEFCQAVDKLLPDSSGSKGIVIDIAKAAIEPLINALSAAVAALYNDYRKDDALTLRTQLEAAKWPAFKDVEPAQ
jgi:hypothetical protein